MAKTLLLLALLSMLPFSLVGCKNSEEKARAIYNQALLAAELKDFRKSETLLMKVVEDYSETVVATEAIQKLPTVLSSLNQKEREDSAKTLLNSAVDHMAALAKKNKTGVKYPITVEGFRLAGLLRNDPNLVLGILFQDVPGYDFVAVSYHKEGTIISTYDSRTLEFIDYDSLDKANAVLGLWDDYLEIDQSNDPMTVSILSRNFCSVYEDSSTGPR